MLNQGWVGVLVIGCVPWLFCGDAYSKDLGYSEGYIAIESRSPLIIRSIGRLDV